MHYTLYLIIVLLALYSCNTKHTNNNQIDKELSSNEITIETHIEKKETIIIDANYTFLEAIEGSKAPQSIIDQLELKI